MSETGTTYAAGKMKTLGAGFTHVRLARCRGGLRLTYRHGAERHVIKVPMDRDECLRVFMAGKNAFLVLAEVAEKNKATVEHTIETRSTIKFRVTETDVDKIVATVAAQDGGQA